jgi:hypothetical protein
VSSLEEQLLSRLENAGECGRKQAEHLLYPFRANSSYFAVPCDFKKSSVTACCAAGVGKMVCPSATLMWILSITVKNATTWRREELKYTGAIFHELRRTAARNMVLQWVCLFWSP